MQYENYTMKKMDLLNWKVLVFFWSSSLRFSFKFFPTKISNQEWMLWKSEVFWKIGVSKTTQNKGKYISISMVNWLKEVIALKWRYRLRFLN